jgi:hypothetical protein
MKDHKEYLKQFDTRFPVYISESGRIRAGFIHNEQSSLHDFIKTALTERDAEWKALVEQAHQKFEEQKKHCADG